ncbi:MAG TPA: hypothetical protein VJ385_16310, partial [Fibrobacteria bacterium]|nr:hypothetical protein [Fibrobacteria bacterium]
MTRRFPKPLPSVVPWILLATLTVQAARPANLETRRHGQTPFREASSLSPEEPPPVGGLAGPTVQDLRAAFPDRALRRVDPVRFERYVSANAFRGRLLTGPALAAALAAAPSAPVAAPVAAQAGPAGGSPSDSA